MNLNDGLKSRNGNIYVHLYIEYDVIDEKLKCKWRDEKSGEWYQYDKDKEGDEIILKERVIWLAMSGDREKSGDRENCTGETILLQEVRSSSHLTRNDILDGICTLTKQYNDIFPLISHVYFERIKKMTRSGIKRIKGHQVYSIGYGS